MFDYDGRFLVATARHQQVIAANVLNFSNRFLVDFPHSLDRNVPLFSFQLLKPQKLLATTEVDDQFRPDVTRQK